MKRLLALVYACCGWLGCGLLMGQSPETTQAQATNATSPAVGAQPSPMIVRDPRTGQLFQQEFQTVDQPVTTWQRKLVDRTVVTPQTVVENQQVPQTSYVAKTEYVLQSKLKGWWNPFAQPTYAYEYVPVTRWVPQTQMVSRQVPTVKMLAKTEQVPVDEPVQTMQKVTHVVMRPLPASGVGVGSSLPTGAVTTNAYANNQVPAYQRPAANSTPVGWPAATNVYANNNGYGYSGAAANVVGNRPLVASVPLFGRQPSQSFQPGTLLTAPMNGLRDIVRATSAPFRGQSSYNGYAQPMNIASQPNSAWGRDLNQSGMRPTVVR